MKRLYYFIRLLNRLMDGLIMIDGLMVRLMDGLFDGLIDGWCHVMSLILCLCHSVTSLILVFKINVVPVHVPSHFFDFSF